MRFATRDAQALGIETVYQDLALADNLGIPANIFLGRELMCRGKLAFPRSSPDDGGVRKAARAAPDPDPDLRQRCAPCPAANASASASPRSVYFNARIIILDEPTAALGVEETHKVLELVKEMRVMASRW